MGTFNKEQVLNDMLQAGAEEASQADWLACLERIKPEFKAQTEEIERIQRDVQQGSISKIDAKPLIQAIENNKEGIVNRLEHACHKALEDAVRAALKVLMDAGLAALSLI